MNHPDRLSLSYALMAKLAGDADTVNPGAFSPQHSSFLREMATANAATPTPTPTPIPKPTPTMIQADGYSPDGPLPDMSRSLESPLIQRLIGAFKQKFSPAAAPSPTPLK